MSKQAQDKPHGTILSYGIGYVLSITLTLIAFALVGQHVNSRHSEHSHGSLMLWISALAIAQLLIQLLFFLHLHREKKPRWNLMAFQFMVLVVVIIVGGSLWIMHNLDYNMMPHEVESYIMEEEAIYR